MKKYYRINQRICKESNFSSFDIMLDDSGIQNFIDLLEGEIKVFELIKSQDNSISNNQLKIKKIKLTFKDDQNNYINSYIEAYKNNIYFKKEFENDLNNILENFAKCGFDHLNISNIQKETI